MKNIIKMRTKIRKFNKDGLIKSLAIASLAPYLWIMPSDFERNPSRVEPDGLEKDIEIKIEEELFQKRESSQKESIDIGSITRYIANHEGFRPSVYCPFSPRETDRSKFKQPTVGFGHYMDNGNSKKTFQKVLPHISWEDVYNGNRNLSREEAEILFSEDLRVHIERTRSIFQDFDHYPLYVQKALADGVYRSCLSGSPKTTRLINEGRFHEAAIEYLNHNEYRDARRNGRRGVEKRMNTNSQFFAKYARESTRS
jgi:hypothetical protein